MSAETNLIDAEVAAYQSRDLERFLSYFSPEVVITAADCSVLLQGTEALRTRYGPLFEDNPDLTVRILARIALGPFVIDHEHIEGLARSSQPPTLEAVCIYRIDGGQIAAMQFLP